MFNVKQIIRHRLNWVRLIPRILRTRAEYKKTLLRIRAKVVRGEKIRILFLLNENAKWKCQTVYEALIKTGFFIPIVALTRADIDWDLTDEEYKEKLDKNIDFCKRNGLNYVVAYSIETHNAIPLNKFCADMVIYTQPWKIADIQKPFHVSSYALTFYIPYYIVCYDAPMVDSQQELHLFIFRYFVLNAFWRNYFRSKLWSMPISGGYEGLGHPSLDLLCVKAEASGISKDKFIIYAPHWSINVGECFSTFLETGMFILEYAKKHRDVQWCFKPHPSLKYALKRYSDWTCERIESYFNEWGMVARVCTDGNYQDLFSKSTTLITDCASFLMEYSTYDRPIIHLVSRNAKFQPARPSKKLFSSFYQAENLEQLKKHLTDIIELGNDYKAKARGHAISAANLRRSMAGAHIADYLVNLANADERK